MKRKSSSPSAFPDLLTEGSIKSLAGQVYFERGWNYFRTGAVRGVKEFDDRIVAQVHGTYLYEVRFRLAGAGLDYSCTCPLGEEGEFCKHCVAAGLQWLESKSRKPAKDKPEVKQVTFADVRSYLLDQEPQVLAEMILEQAKKDDHLYQGLLAKAARSSAKGVDLAAYRAAINAAVEIDDFVSYREAYDYFCGIEEEIKALAELFQQGHAAETIELTEYALSEVEGAIELVDDSDGGLSTVIESLEELHLKACRKARPDPEELARRLFHWELNSEGDVFYGAASTYASVLGKKGLAVYRGLAEAEFERFPELKPGQRDDDLHSRRFRVTSMMEALATKTGGLDELIRVKSRDLSSPWNFLQIAEECKKARSYDQALEWAERGVREFPNHRDDRLLVFIAEERQRRKQGPEAMKLIWKIFENDPGLSNYKLLKSHAERAETWPPWRDRALKLIREKTSKAMEKRSKPGAPRLFGPDHSVLVEIFLWEKDPEAAWQEAEAGGCRECLWLDLARKRAPAHPEDAVRVYQRLVDSTLKQTGEKFYQTACAYLKEINSLMKGMSRQAEFELYLRELRSTHKRKRNFIKKLDRMKLP